MCGCQWDRTGNGIVVCSGVVGPDATRGPGLGWPVPAQSAVNPQSVGPELPASSGQWPFRAQTRPSGATLDREWYEAPLKKNRFRPVWRTPGRANALVVPNGGPTQCKSPPLGARAPLRPDVFLCSWDPKNTGVRGAAGVVGVAGAGGSSICPRLDYLPPPCSEDLHGCWILARWLRVCCPLQMQAHPWTFIRSCQLFC